jgi:2-methylcitrate dehydratase
MPLLVKKFEANLATRFPVRAAKPIRELCMDRAKFESTPVDEFMGLWVAAHD